MPSNQETQVLIIGGGIGGLTLAALCKRLNISCLVLERSSKVSLLRVLPAPLGLSHLILQSHDWWYDEFHTAKKLTQK